MCGGLEDGRDACYNDCSHDDKVNDDEDNGNDDVTWNSDGDDESIYVLLQKVKRIEAFPTIATSVLNSTIYIIQP